MCGHPVTQHYRQRRVWKVSLKVLATIWKYRRFTDDSACPYNEVKGQLHFVLSTFFIEHFNHHLHSRGERNEEQRRTKISFGRTMIRALELLRLAKRHVLGQSDVEQWRNHVHSFSSYWVMIVWRHQIISHSIKNLLNRKFLKFLITT